MSDLFGGQSNAIFVLQGFETHNCVKLTKFKIQQFDSCIKYSFSVTWEQECMAKNKKCQSSSSNGEYGWLDHQGE